MADYQHQQRAKIGVLIVNTGTPAAPTKQALRPYLKQFLWDRRIVDTPRWLWWLVLNAIILTTRPKKSARAYQRIWTERGSPLAVHTEDQANAIQLSLHSHWGESLVVDWAMRYGDPGIESKLQSLQQQGVEKLLVLPMFPQYASATTASIFDAVANYYRQQMWLPEIHFVGHYCDHPLYITALADSVRQHWQQHGRADKILFSYHGEPLRYLQRGDPYHCQCLKTTRLVAEQLALQPMEYLTTFQSRFGPGDWLQPYTDETLKALPQQNVKHVQILCPGFAADCLETVDEIAIENKRHFLSAGGNRFEYIPALNANEQHIAALVNIIATHVNSWASLKQDNREVNAQRYAAHAYNKL